MFNLKYIKHIFYVHREAAFAMCSFVFAAGELIALLLANDPFIQAIAAISCGVFTLITVAMVYGIYRFEKKYGGRP